VHDEAASSEDRLEGAVVEEVCHDQDTIKTEQGGRDDKTWGAA
jgi:hypothetical protein